LILNKIMNIEEIKKLEMKEYEYKRNLSNEKKLVFIKKMK